MNNRADTLRSLQERVRQAKGPDRELDDAIYEAMTGKCAHKSGGFIHCAKCGEDSTDFAWTPLYTASLDACVQLLKDVLPGWGWSVSGNRLRTNGGTSFAMVSVPIGYDGPAPWPEGYLHHDSACIALLYAILSAVLAQMETEKAAP